MLLVFFTLGGTESVRIADIGNGARNDDSCAPPFAADFLLENQELLENLHLRHGP